MTIPRLPTRCDGCGQTDDHPKHHYNAQTFHFDCTPAYVIDDMTSETFYKHVPDVGMVMVDRIPLPENSYSDGTKHFLKVRELAQKGTHGDKLVAKIATLVEEN